MIAIDQCSDKVGEINLKELQTHNTKKLVKNEARQQASSSLNKLLDPVPSNVRHKPIMFESFTVQYN